MADGNLHALLFGIIIGIIVFALLDSYRGGDQ